MKIYTFGDSHSSSGFNKIHLDNVEIFINWMGPHLLHSVGRDGLSLLNIKQHGLSAGDTVIFCFGEIDCRCHIDKYKSNYKETIDTMVQKYINTIDLNANLIPGLKICVYNVVPPVRKSSHIENNSFPFLGTDEERKTYTKYMNSKLEECCNAKNYTFFNVYDKYTDTDGYLNPSLSDGNVHISNPVYMIEFIKDRLRSYP